MTHNMDHNIFIHTRVWNEVKINWLKWLMSNIIMSYFIKLLKWNLMMKTMLFFPCLHQFAFSWSYKRRTIQYNGNANCNTRIKLQSLCSFHVTSLQTFWGNRVHTLVWFNDDMEISGLISTGTTSLHINITIYTYQLLLYFPVYTYHSTYE